jgi:hypothetical protein
MQIHPFSHSTRQNKVISLTVITLSLMLAGLPFKGFSQNRIIYRDTIVHRIIYKDTVVYRYDTIKVMRYVRLDTLWSPSAMPLVSTAPETKKKGLINPNNWGIGPSIGAYYSPFHGFDLNIGFGIQYYFLAIPTFRNPHMGHRRGKK